MAITLEEFTQLYLSCEQQLHHFIARKFYPRAHFFHMDVDDLCQETFLRAWKGAFSIPQMHMSTSDCKPVFLGYLYKVATNLIIDLYRRPSYERSSFEEWGYTVESDPADIYCMAEPVYQVLESLSKKEREILTRIYLEDQTYEQVAASFGCTYDTIKQRLLRARKAFCNIYLQNNPSSHQYQHRREGHNTKLKVEEHPSNKRKQLFPQMP